MFLCICHLVWSVSCLLHHNIITTSLIYLQDVEMTLGASGCDQCVGSVGMITDMVSGCWIYVLLHNEVYLYTPLVTVLFDSLTPTLCSIFVIFFHSWIYIRILRHSKLTLFQCTCLKFNLKNIYVPLCLTRGYVFHFQYYISNQ